MRPDEHVTKDTKIAVFFVVYLGDALDEKSVNFTGVRAIVTQGYCRARIRLSLICNTMLEPMTAKGTRCFSLLFTLKNIV